MRWLVTQTIAVRRHSEFSNKIFSVSDIHEFLFVCALE